jgi:signal transduction histidine kinase
VEAHGGALSLETGHGSGTSVFVRLPAARADGANDMGRPG